MFAKRGCLKSNALFGTFHGAALLNKKPRFKGTPFKSPSSKLVERARRLYGAANSHDTPKK